MKNIIRKIPIINLIARPVYRYLEGKRGSRRFQKLIKQPGPLRLVIGASGVFDDGWIGTDIQYLNLLIPEHWERSLQTDSVDAMLAEHVWEHLTPEQGLIGAKRCFQYMKPGGYLRVAVPDGYQPDPNYINHVKPGGTGEGADDHKVLYNHETFAALFEQAGFQVKRLESFDDQGAFHENTWDEKDGKIFRSKRFDGRNQGDVLGYTSIILDAYKKDTA